MDKNSKEQQGEEISNNMQASMDRRDFLRSLKKWSKIVIGGALVGSALLSGNETQAAAWANRGGGGGAWGNHGGGTTWVNRAGGGGWGNHGGGSAWGNHGGGTSWANRGAGWANHGSTWINRF